MVVRACGCCVYLFAGVFARAADWQAGHAADLGILRRFAFCDIQLGPGLSNFGQYAHDFARLPGGAVRHAGIVGNLLARQVERDAPGVDAHDAVGYALKIAGDVTGKQHAALPVAGEFAQPVEHAIARNRVQTGGCLVEYQQVSAVRKRYG